MSENKPIKDVKDTKIEAQKEAEIIEDISEAVGTVVVPKAPVSTAAPEQRRGGSGGGGPRRGGFQKRDREDNKDGFEEKVITVDRVTRVVKGGRRMRFRALVVIGDKKGKVGYALGKGNEVAMAVAKAVKRAKKHLLELDVSEGTIAHDMVGKSRSTRVLLKSAKKDRGLIAGGSVRAVLELAGYSDIVAKSYGSNNKTNNVIATLDALSRLLVRKVSSKPKPKAQKESK
jgi:small subunit ribosomal protein S5